MAFTPPRSDSITDGTDSATVRDTGTEDALNVAVVDAAGNQITGFGGGTEYDEDTPHVSGEKVTMAGVVQQTADAALSGDGDRSELQVDETGFLKVNVKTGGTGGTQYAEDTPHASGDLVNMAGVVQQTADAALSGDGDRSAMQVDSSGWLKVNVKAGSAGGVSHTDDAPFTVAVDDVVPAAGMFDDAGPDSVDEGDAGVLRMSANRNLYTQIRDGTAERSAEVTAANALKVDGSAVTQPVSGTVSVTEPVSVDDNGGSLTVDAPVATPVAARLSDGAAFYDATKTGQLPAALVGGRLDVNVGNTVTVAEPVSVDDNGGSLTVDGTVTANQGTAGAAWEVVGDVAADAAVPANPLSVGGRASTAVPAAVSADGDSVYEWLTRQGAPVVTMAPHVGLFGSQPWNLVSETAQYTTTQTSAVLVAGGASERLVVTYIQIQAGGTTAGTLQVYFGTGAYSRGTNFAIFDGEFAPSATLKPGFVANGPFISATNGDDLLVTTSAAINPLTITVWYYVVT